MIYVNHKVVGLDLGLQGGYTKYLCFLCLWDSLADNQHYVRQVLSLRQGLKPGSHNVQSHPLVEPNKILLPPLHIKLGVMKNFFKAIDRESCGFAFLQKFPRINMKIFKDPMFDEALREAELSTW